MGIFKYDKASLIRNGIYSISFIGSDKFYIGAATKKHTKWNESGFYVRWRQHISALFYNKHYNSKLQNSFNKYGITSIVFKIEQFIDNGRDAIFLEEDFLIKKLNSVKCGYNMRSKEDFGEYKRTGFNVKPLYVFNIKGELINTFKSQTDGAKSLNIDKRKLSYLIKYNRTDNNMVFSLSKEFICKIKTKRDINKGRFFIIYDSKKDCIYEHCCVRKSIIKFGLNCESRNVYNCLNNKIPSTNGYIFIYKDKLHELKVIEREYYCLFKNDTLYLKFNSLLNLSEYINKSETAIDNHMKGIGRHMFIKEDLRKIRMPIPIYDLFLNKLKENKYEKSPATGSI